MFRWFKQPAPEPDPMVQQLIETLRSQAEAQQKLMERMLDQSATQAAQTQELMQSMMDLWKPSRDPQSNSLDERALAKEADEKAWEPIPFNIFEQLDSDIGVPEEFLR
jgi:hypothetical protein